MGCKSEESLLAEEEAKLLVSVPAEEAVEELISLWEEEA